MAKQEVKQNKGLVIVIASIAALGGLLFGFDTGVISGAIPFLQDYFELTDSQVENVTALGLIGAVVGALVTGRLTDFLGRRKVILGSAFVFATGAIWTGFAPTVTQLMISRFYLGLAIGVSSFAVPLYISEISPTKIRGRLVSMFQLLITVGILAAYLSDRALADNSNPESWRPMLWVGVFPAIILFVGMFFLPDTPRWLMSKGREKESRRILAKIEFPEFIDKSISEMKQQIALEEMQAGWREIFKPWLRNALIIAVGIMFFQQFVGINTVIYYSPKIFLAAGFEGNEAAIAASVIVGVVNVLFTIVSLFVIDRLGRRKLFFIGVSGITIALISMGLGFMIEGVSKWFLVTSMLVYIAFFAISLGPLGWLIITEVFPTRVRGLGSSIGSLSNWGFNTLVVWTFFKMASAFGNAKDVVVPEGSDLSSVCPTCVGSVFWVFAAIALIGLVWGYFFIPETKNVSLEEIEAHWRDGKKPRDLKAG
ncbi:MAG: sugar porter family MFS transporter [Bacteroidales bacterium]|nr:sugar porter family MFS transporter [Bacteroidales bacterium]MDT8430883.1 sugar porter family MFS transporter [Bacteroidales bacterium]